MPDEKTPVSHVVDAITEHNAQIRALPPDERNRHRVGVGAGLLGLGGWIGGLVLLGMLADGRETSDQALAYLRAPSSIPETVWLPAAIWVAVMATGVLLLGAGLRRTRNQPRDMLAAAKALVRLALFASLLWWRWFPVPDGNTTSVWVGLGFLLLPGIYIGGVAESAILLFVSLRGPSFRARKVVQEHMQENAIPWKPARRRQF